MLTIWEQQVYAMGEWLMHCKEFAALPLRDKMTIFKISCAIWRQFERTTISIDLFGWRAVTKKLLAVSSKIVIVNDETMKYDDMSWVTDCDPSYVKSLFDPFAGRIIEEVAKTCLELAISPMEVTYILCTLMWHVEGQSVNPATLLIAESYREMISDDLHNYYVGTLKTPNYAARLIRIMSIVHCIENIYYERSKIVEIARIFDVVKFDVSGRGLFS
ncbi:Ligand-binding domain of nuclear hormone receptor [Oesophagostomum dentatum]|uniref:Ligand-binding domain of nuclear hormone receptor n=1 Tax=Oesophagostomum dentatum TaxID=61180 RepID=A0A0B1TM35_OESDE|nr:Ligand-binding domain of nuclear hormone receptor [Oesophagostomum dentatum]